MQKRVNQGKYKLNPETGKYLPRVTHILNIIDKGEGFYNWLKKEGSNADVIMKKAGDIGSGLHNILEKIAKGEKIATGKLKGLNKKWTTEFLKWKDANIEKFIESEKTVYSESYIGTLDSLVLKKDMKVALLDYKTSGQIYDTVWLQLSAYWKAYELHNPTRIDEAYVLHFSKETGKLTVKQFSIGSYHLDLELHYNIFLKALGIWNWRYNKKGGQK